MLPGRRNERSPQGRFIGKVNDMKNNWLVDVTVNEGRWKWVRGRWSAVKKSPCLSCWPINPVGQTLLFSLCWCNLSKKYIFDDVLAEKMQIKLRPVLPAERQTNVKFQSYLKAWTRTWDGIKTVFIIWNVEWTTKLLPWRSNFHWSGLQHIHFGLFQLSESEARKKSCSPVVLLTSYIYKLKIFPKLCDHVLVIITDKSRPLTRPLPRHHWSRRPLLIGRTRTPISNPVNSPRPRYNLHSVLISLTEEWRGQGHDAKRWQILVTEQSKEVGWRWGWCVVVVVGGGILLMGL